MSTNNPTTNELTEILDSFSKNAEPFAETDIADALRRFISRFSEHPPTQEALAELVAFQFRPRQDSESGGWNTYFGPMVTWKNEDGTVSENPTRERITPNIIDYWQRRAQEETNPILRARYADLVWDFSQGSKERKEASDCSRIAIDSYALIASCRIHKHPTDVIQKLNRALSLALSINDSVMVNRTISAIIKFEDDIAEDEKLGLWGFSFDILLNDKKMPISLHDEKTIIRNLESRLERLSRSAERSSQSVFATESAALRLASYYRRKESDGDLQRVLTEYSNTVGKYCESSSSLEVSSWLQRLHSVLLSYGQHDMAQKIRIRIGETGPDLVKTLKRISAEAKIPVEEMDRFVQWITDGNLPIVLKKIAIHFIPRKDQVESQIRNLSTIAPLSFRFPKPLLDREGRTVGVVGSLESDMDGNIVYYMSQNMSISSIFLRRALEMTKEKFSPNCEDFLDFLYTSPIFRLDKKPILKSGIDAFLNEEPLVSMHLLIPQIEDTIRHLVQMTSGNILKPRPYGGFYLRNLDELLREDKVESVFGKDISFYFRVLFTDQRGFNLRNDVCHGILPYDSFGFIYSDRVFHSMLCLALVKEKNDLENS
jgi:hypothetical protein